MVIIIYYLNAKFRSMYNGMLDLTGSHMLPEKLARGRGRGREMNIQYVFVSCTSSSEALEHQSDFVGLRTDCDGIATNNHSQVRIYSSNQLVAIRLCSETFFPILNLPHFITRQIQVVCSVSFSSSFWSP